MADHVVDPTSIMPKGTAVKQPSFARWPTTVQHYELVTTWRVTTLHIHVESHGINREYPNYTFLFWFTLNANHDLHDLHDFICYKRITTKLQT